MHPETQRLMAEFADEHCEESVRDLARGYRDLAQATVATLGDGFQLRHWLRETLILRKCVLAQALRGKEESSAPRATTYPRLQAGS